MQFAHAGNDGLFGFFVKMRMERGVFVGQLGQCFAQLVAVFLVLDVDFHLDDGRRHLDGFEQHGMVFVAEGVTGAGVFHTHQCDDFAGSCLVDFLAFLGLDAEDAAHTLVLAFVDIVQTHATAQFAAEDADECLLAHVGVVDEFESQG